MKDFDDDDDPLDRPNIVSFPISPELAAATRRYHAELDRVDRLEYEGKRPRFREQIKAAYFSALFERCFS